VAEVASILGGDPALGDRLARWTLDQACRDAAHWLAGGLALRLAVGLPAALAPRRTSLFGAAVPRAWCPSSSKRR